MGKRCGSVKARQKTVAEQVAFEIEQAISVQFPREAFAKIMSGVFRNIVRNDLLAEEHAKWTKKKL